MPIDNDFQADFEFDTEAFSDFEIDFETDTDFETRYIKPPRTKEIPEHRLKYKNAEELAKKLVIEEASRYFVIVDGRFIFGDLIEAMVVHNNWLVKKMTISTLSMSQNNIDSLANLLNGGYLEELNLIISDYFFSHERHALIKYAYDILDVDNKFQMAVASTHCKLCIFELENGRKIVIHGSANLRSSSNIEQLVIEESKQLYDFNNEYQDRIINVYKTINKSLRRTKLWNAVTS